MPPPPPSPSRHTDGPDGLRAAAAELLPRARRYSPPGSGITRRQVLAGLTAAAALLQAGLVRSPAAAAESLDPITNQTLEAFADTIVPGQKRSSGDQAIAGAVSGPGAVQAGAIAAYTLPELPLALLLPGMAAALNTAAAAYAVAHVLWLDPLLPAFVALPFEHRTALAEQLLTPEIVDKGWMLLAGLASLAFDTAMHLHTPDVAGSHPGLVFIRFPLPDADGLWRFPSASYRRVLATPYPATTSTGSPA